MNSLRSHQFGGGKGIKRTVDTKTVRDTENMLRIRSDPTNPNRRVLFDQGPWLHTTWHRVLVVVSDDWNSWHTEYWRHEEHDAFRIISLSPWFSYYLCGPGPSIDATVVGGTLTRLWQLGDAYYVPPTVPAVQDLCALLSDWAARYESLRL